jgi:hypothetical protein
MHLNRFIREHLFRFRLLYKHLTVGLQEKDAWSPANTEQQQYRVSGWLVLNLEGLGFKSWPGYLLLWSWLLVIFLNTVTCEGVAWLILMGSGLDDWIYWHFFTITSRVNYNSSVSDCLRLPSFLTGLRVSSLPLWRMTNEESLPNEFLNFLTDELRLTYERTLLSILMCPLFRTSGEPNRDHQLEQFAVILLLFVFCPLLRSVATCYYAT